MTITDFLLARIAEDEGAEVELGSRFHPFRVMAECRAKRRIVEDWQSLADRRDDQNLPVHLSDPVASALLKATEPWIRTLAAVYSDHSDYRAEWRP